jgi:hypothetical protein
MKNLKAQILGVLRSIYIFKGEEIDVVSGRLDSLPDEGLLKVLDILNEVKGKQDDFLRKMNLRDRDFNKKLKVFLKAEYKKATEGATKMEQDNAENILTNLDV